MDVWVAEAEVNETVYERIVHTTRRGAKHDIIMTCLTRDDSEVEWEDLGEDESQTTAMEDGVIHRFYIEREYLYEGDDYNE